MGHLSAAHVVRGRLSLRCTCVVVSNNFDTLALKVSRYFGVPVHHPSQTTTGPETDLDLTILQTLTRAGTKNRFLAV